MVPYIYCGPEGYNPEAGTLYPGRKFYPGAVSAELIAEWLENGWLEDGATQGEPDSAAYHIPAPVKSSKD